MCDFNQYRYIDNMYTHIYRYISADPRRWQGERVRGAPRRWRPSSMSLATCRALSGDFLLVSESNVRQ